MTAPATSPDAPSTTLLAAVVAAGVAAVLVLLVATLAFSTHNTRATVDGDTATTSQWVAD